jgi:hypothetical protein
MISNIYLKKEIKGKKKGNKRMEKGKEKMQKKEEENNIFFNYGVLFGKRFNFNPIIERIKEDVIPLIDEKWIDIIDSFIFLLKDKNSLFEYYFDDQSNKICTKHSSLRDEELDTIFIDHTFYFKKSLEVTRACIWLKEQKIGNLYFSVNFDKGETDTRPFIVESRIYKHFTTTNYNPLIVSYNTITKEKHVFTGEKNNFHYVFEDFASDLGNHRQRK